MPAMQLDVTEIDQQPNFVNICTLCHTVWCFVFTKGNSTGVWWSLLVGFFCPIQEHNFTKYIDQVIDTKGEECNKTCFK